MKADVYTYEGKKNGSVTLPEAVFGVKWNEALVSQVVRAMQANARTPVADTKGRGEVRGGGKKPWKQKGTGRARHGSIRSPIWKGGGVTHGPLSEKNYAQKVNRKMRTKALFSVLSKKFTDGSVIFVDALPFETPKTKDAKRVLDALAVAGVKISKKRNAVLVSIPESNPIIKKSFRNMGNVVVETTQNLNPVDALTYAHIVVIDPDRSVAVLAKRNEK